jgi:hypothetical protein
VTADQVAGPVSSATRTAARTNAARTNDGADGTVIEVVVDAGDGQVSAQQAQDPADPADVADQPEQAGDPQD